MASIVRYQVNFSFSISRSFLRFNKTHKFSKTQLIRFGRSYFPCHIFLDQFKLDATYFGVITERLLQVLLDTNKSPKLLAIFNIVFCTTRNGPGKDTPKKGRRRPRLSPGHEMPLRMPVSA
eukprot:TRINITY_DN9403_c0_g3_i1.p2 TRINITY_DN9403_c0_g3~~TRINITY_DN9403_c0_g3_i1.p2  ORF type:complete len:121 (-),score=3.43 TRINITY_DN9403_c0_g3_i1:48-410(-)